MIAFFNKMKGGKQSPPSVNFSEILWSWLGALLYEISGADIFVLMVLFWV